MMLRNSRLKTPLILKLLKQLTIKIQLLPPKLRLLNSKNGLLPVIKFLPMLGIKILTLKTGNSLGSRMNARH